MLRIYHHSFYGFVCVFACVCDYCVSVSARKVEANADEPILSLSVSLCVCVCALRNHRHRTVHANDSNIGISIHYAANGWRVIRDHISFFAVSFCLAITFYLIPTCFGRCGHSSRHRTLGFGSEPCLPLLYFFCISSVSAVFSLSFALSFLLGVRFSPFCFNANGTPKASGELIVSNSNSYRQRCRYTVNYETIRCCRRRQPCSIVCSS